MTDTRKIRIRLNLDVTLDQSEYGGGTAEEALAYIKTETKSPYRLAVFLEDWTLLEDADFSAEIVK